MPSCFINAYLVLSEMPQHMHIIIHQTWNK